MNTAVLITLIVVGGIVIISLTAIAWLWRVTGRGISSLPFPGGQREVTGRIDFLEEEIRELRRDVDDLKSRMSR